eukprot:12399542-Karenia_brevis.AAC.1
MLRAACIRGYVTHMRDISLIGPVKTWVQLLDRWHFCIFWIWKTNCKNRHEQSGSRRAGFAIAYVKHS